MGELVPLFTKPRLVSDGPGPAERLLKAHDVAQEAELVLDAGERGSGLALLLHAAATRLSLTCGYEAAARVVDGVAASLRDRPGPAA